MITCKKGTRLFCDFPFGGKPKAIAIEVIQAGNGKDSQGKVRVRLTETSGAYRKGEILELTTYQAVCSGQFFTRVSTLYNWTL